MSKKFKYEVEGVESGYVPNVGQVTDGKIESDHELVGSQFKLIGEENGDPAGTVGLQGEEPAAKQDSVIGPDQPLNNQGLEQ